MSTSEKGLVKTVQGEVVSRKTGKGSRWKWSEKKRKALKQLLAGSPSTEVAERLDVSRNTLLNWSKHPEWIARVQQILHETQTASKLRRISMTGAIADKLGAQAYKALDTKDEEGNPKELDPNAGLFLRSHLEYAKAERQFFGEEGGASGNIGPIVNITVGGNGPNSVAPVNLAQESTSLVAFRDFVKRYDPKLAVVAHNPEEAAALLVEKVMQESNLLDTVREENRAEFRVEAELEEAKKAKK